MKFEDLKDLLKEKKRLRRNLLFIIIGLISAIAGIVLCLTWFGWKLLLVVLLLTYSNNLNNKLKD
jgi:hypothetical protein